MDVTPTTTLINFPEENEVQYQGSGCLEKWRFVGGEEVKTDGDCCDI